MRKFVASIIAVVTLAIGAFACGYVHPTNVGGIRWQDCPETNQYAVGNYGPRMVTVTFTAIFGDGGTDTETVTLAPAHFAPMNADGSGVANVVVNNIQVF